MSETQFKLPDQGISLEALEKHLILQALEKSSNNKTQAAKLLDISYDSLRYQLKKFGINWNRPNKETPSAQKFHCLSLLAYVREWFYDYDDDK